MSLTRPYLFPQRDLDDGDTFAAPVVETFPDLADAYKAIENPMDFRTIEEERLQYYRSITDLQQDLLLVFHNCLEFSNGVENEYTAVAR